MPMITKWEPRVGEVATIRQSSATIAATNSAGGTELLAIPTLVFSAKVIKTFHDDETGQIVHCRVIDSDAIKAICKQAGEQFARDPIIRFWPDTIELLGLNEAA